MRTLLLGELSVSRMEPTGAPRDLAFLTPTSPLAMGYTAAVLLLYLFRVAALRRRVTHGGIMNVLATLGLIPLFWILNTAFWLIPVPWLLGYAWLLIRSW